MTVPLVTSGSPSGLASTLNASSGWVPRPTQCPAVITTGPAAAAISVPVQLPSISTTASSRTCASASAPRYWLIGVKSSVPPHCEYGIAVRASGHAGGLRGSEAPQPAATETAITAIITAIAEQGGS